MRKLTHEDILKELDHQFFRLISETADELGDYLQDMLNGIACTYAVRLKGSSLSSNAMSSADGFATYSLNALQTTLMLLLLTRRS